MLDQRTQLGRLMVAAGEVEKEPGKRRQEILQQRHEIAALDPRPEGLLDTEGDAATGQRGADHQQHVVGGDLRVHLHVEGLAVLDELPAVRRRGRRHAPADAAVVHQLARVLRRAVAGDVGGRGHGQFALRAGDGHGHHVLFDYLAQAHAGIEAGGYDVVLFVADGDIERDAWMGLHEAREQRA